MVAQKGPDVDTQLDQELEKLADTRGLARLVFWVLGGGFGGFMIRGSTVPLDEGVPTLGSVVLDKK